MAEIVVVEGLTDAGFFQELLIRLYLRAGKRQFSSIRGREKFPAGVAGFLSDGSALEVAFEYPEDRPPGGISQIPAHVRALLDTQVLKFVVAADIDDGTPDQIVQSTVQVVCTHLGIAASTVSVNNHTLELEDGMVTVIPVGLKTDTTLSSLGLVNHQLEDYLVKIILEDPSLREAAPELYDLLLEILPAVRSHDGAFNSSKELFQLIKPIVKHSFSDTGVVQKVIRDGDEGVLRAVLSPILADLESALNLCV